MCGCDASSPSANCGREGRETVGRATGSSTHLALRTSVQAGKPIATSALVVAELLSGIRGELRAASLLQLLGRFEILIPGALRDYQGAARVYRICRRPGFTIRSTVDCMVAATALRELIRRQYPAELCDEASR